MLCPPGTMHQKEQESGHDTCMISAAAIFPFSPSAVRRAPVRRGGGWLPGATDHQLAPRRSGDACRFKKAFGGWNRQAHFHQNVGPHYLSRLNRRCMSYASPSEPEGSWTVRPIVALAER